MVGAEALLPPVGDGRRNNSSSSNFTAGDPSLGGGGGKPPSPRPRTGSEDTGGSMYGYPPTHISYQSAGGRAYDQSRARIDSGGGAPLPGHHRVRSWSGSAAQAYYGTSPMHGYPVSSSGVPTSYGAPTAVFPPVNKQQQPLTSSMAGSRRKRKAGAAHRRVQSYSDTLTVGSYGSFPPELLVGAQLPAQAGTSKGEFSPKAEFMKLTGSLRSQSPVRFSRSVSPVPPSPSMRATAAPPSPQSSVRGMNGISGYSAIPPPPADGSGPMPGLGVYGMDGASAAMGMSGYLTSSTRSGSELGGEAVFAAQQKGGNHKRTQSSRRMHMRQKSAQLFMEDVKGQEQTPSCRDIIFLFLFVFHLLGIFYLGNTFGYEAVRFHDGNEDDSTFTIIYQNLVFVSLLSGVVAIIISDIILFLMMTVAKRIVQIALILTIALSFVWGTMGIGLSPRKVVPATGIIALALSVAYSIVVWERCKFHGSNLYASLTGIRVNPGAVIVALLFQFLALLWSIYFTYVAVGVYDAIEIGEIELSSQASKISTYAAMGFSYYWTLQVFLNIVQVTVAGIIGSWWYTPDGDTRTRGEDLRRSFFRSIFYATGSICYGSLLIGPVRILRQISALFRPSDERNSLLCFHECIHCIQACLTSCVDSLADRFNPFALTYVGLYGYNLTDAGLNATELFEKRGWTTIVSDDLVPNVMLLTCLVIAGVTGCFAQMLDNMESLALSSLNEPVLVSFVAGASVGFVASSVLFGIICSSVNAVIVCFASSPVDFHTNHPELSSEMRTAWREVWPGCMDVVDIRMAVANYLDPSAGNNGALGEHQPLLIP